MLAIECSKPSATKAEIGKTIARILPDTLCAANDSQIARQTSALANTPRRNASAKSSSTLAVAIATAVAATAPSPIAKAPDRCTAAAVPPAPTKLAANTRAQFRSSRVSEILPLAHAMTIRLLPVNSSAPAMTTRTRPSEKATPPSTRVRPKPSAAPVTVSVKYMPPKAMNTPANRPRMTVSRAGSCALRTPTFSTSWAISAGA